ncbi:helix-turn-helix domain-containing protein [Bifidobacterium crudilactis]|jgi:DNA-binding transcriptional ArsR family regulator|uniref:helix-turn-helix domain-containing protein n=1 Tax=Bifidobacterium crudilactis TaxID=327277 RepID=UPI0023540361|nr:helix-turn-helix domain-containing protein [Bifidobacterium crudilactis]MCI1218514.1 helix-turn-helix domain-containing protein [Bifidobacterium crudilactis]
MSVGAVDWAIRFAPVGSDQPARAILISLANLVDDEGHNAHPSAKKLAQWNEMGVSTVRRKLKYLEEQGLIRRGDQRMVAHFDPYHRPVVWDLCLDRKRQVEFTFGDDITASRGGRPRGAVEGTGNSMPAVGTTPSAKPTSIAGGGFDDANVKETPSRVDTGFHSCDSGEVSVPTHGTSLVRDNPLPPSGDSPKDCDGRPADTTLTADQARELCRLMMDCRSQAPALPVDRLERPSQRMIGEAMRLIDRHGYAQVCAVARWATLPPDAATADTPVCADGFWRPTITDPIRLSRKYATLLAQMQRPAPGSTHGSTAPPTPSYGMRTALDRRVDRLLEPFGESDGNDGLVARRTLVELLRTGVEERTAVSRALAVGRDALDSLRRQRETDQARERERRNRPVRHMFAGHIPNREGTP